MTEYNHGEIRIAAVISLLGFITNQVRLIKIKSEGRLIKFTCFTEGDPSEEFVENMSEVTTQIVANFPECDLEETVCKLDGPFPSESVILEGWIYQRHEG